MESTSKNQKCEYVENILTDLISKHKVDDNPRGKFKKASLILLNKNDCMANSSMIFFRS